MGDVPAGIASSTRGTLLSPFFSLALFLSLKRDFFEEGLLAHPHPDVRNEIKIVTDWRRLEHVALSLMSLHSSWSSLCREGPGPTGESAEGGSCGPNKSALALKLWTGLRAASG